MKSFLDNVFLGSIGPAEVFEQLEERIVLDATIGNVTDQAVTEASTMNVNPQTPDTSTYDLQIDGATVSDFNSGLGADVNFDPATGQIDWTPSNYDVGSHIFILSSNDGMNGAEPHTDSKSFTVTVANRDPFITTPSSTSWTEDIGSQQFTVSADYNEGGSITTSGLPSWLTIVAAADGQSATLQGDPTDSETGAHPFTITFNDSHNGETSQLFTLTVNNVLDFTSANSHTSLEDQQLLFNVQTDTETLGVNTVSYSLTGSVPGWVSIDPSTGIISGNPDNTHVGTYSFTVNAASAEGSLSQTFSLAVSNAPGLFLNGDPSILMTETSGNQTFDVQNNDEGFPLPGTEYSIASVTFNGTPISNPGWLGINSSTGMITGNPLSDDVGTYQINVEFDDGNGAANSVTSQMFTLTVSNIKNFFESPNATTWTEDVIGQTFDVKTHEESQIGATVTYDLIGAPSWVVFEDTNDQDGSSTGVLKQNGSLDNSYVGSHSFTIRSYEYNGAPAVDQIFTLTVENVAPVITSPATWSVVEDATAGSLLVPVILDFNEPGVSFSILAPSPSIDGQPIQIVQVDDHTANLVIPTPRNADVDGIYVFNIVADDGKGGKAIQFFTLDVTNKAPVFTDLPAVAGIPALPTVTVTEDSSFSFDINDSVAPDKWDNDETDGPTTYSLVGAPGFLTIDADSGVISGTPNNLDVGTHVFTVRLDDGHGGVVTQQIRIIVSNLAPSFNTVASETWYEDGDIDANGTPDGEGYQSFNINTAGGATDEGQGATYSLSATAPSWLHFDTNTGHMWYVPTNAEVGTFTFDVTINDNTGQPNSTATQSFTLVVENSPPVFDGLYGSGATTLYVNTNGGMQSFDLQTTDESSDRPAGQGGPNKYDFDPSNLPTAGVSLDSSTGVLIVNPLTAPASQTFRVSFFDGTTTVYKELTVVNTITPPIGGDFSAGFYSPNNTTFIEDTGNQTFNIQYMTEGVSFTLRYDLVGAPSWVVFEDTGTQLGSATGVIMGDPTNVETTDVNPGPYSFGIRVYDAAASLDSTTGFTLGVTNNPPLFIEAPFNVVFTEDVAYTLASTPYDINTSDELHNNSSYPNQYSLGDGTDTRPGWLQIDESSGRIYIDKGAVDPYRNTIVNSDDYGPGADGDWDLRVFFNDAHGGMIERLLTVSIQNVLTFTDPGHGYAVTWQEDTASPFVNFFARTNDDSFETPTYPVTFSLASVPSWLQGKISIDTNTGQITTTAGFSPDNSVPGAYAITVAADDGHGPATRNITITVPNRDPVFDPVVAQMDEDGGVDVINLFADDEDDTKPPTMYYTWTGAPQFMELDPFTGEITADPTNKHVGTYNVTVTAWDLQGLNHFGYIDASDADGIQGFTTQTFTIEVVNRAPVFLSGSNATATEDAAFQFNVQMDDEADGRNALPTATPPLPAVHPEYKLVGAPIWLSIDSETGIMTGSPENPEVGTYTFQIEAYDGTLEASNNPVKTVQDFTLTVNNRLPYYSNPDPLAPTYVFELTEDATTAKFDLLSEDEGQHVDANPDDQDTAVYYYLDPLTTPPGVRFESDGTSWQIEDASQPGKYLSSITGKFIVAPTNSDVFGNHLPGITFPVRVFDGHKDASNDPTFVDVNINVAIHNTEPVFTTPNGLVWIEDNIVNAPDLNTTDEPFQRFQGANIAYSLSGAPAWLRIDALTGKLYANIDPLQGDYTRNADGSPDNHMVGDYTFTVNFSDGTVTRSQSYDLQVINDPTAITQSPSDRHLVEDTSMTVTDGQVQAKDEYVGYSEDYYELFIDWENQDLLNNLPNTWRTLSGPTGYNTWNNSWDPTAGDIANNITFDTKTGAITWTPNNGDVPNSTSDGIYRHEFIIVHHDGHNTVDTKSFFVYIDNVAPTLPQDPGHLQSWPLIEDTSHTYNAGYVQSDEEGQGVTYRLQVSVKGDGSDWTNWNAFAGRQPNGPAGGAITFWTATGQISWRPTNADVTFDENGDASVPYKFRVQANDGNASASNPGENLSPWREFDVTVVNQGPTVDNLSDTYTINEDSPYFQTGDLDPINVGSRDEEIQSTNTFRHTDAYYQLFVTPPGGAEFEVVPDDPLETTRWWSYAPNGVNGGTIYFDKDAGLVYWRDPSNQALERPNDLDVGRYTFRVVHHDGRGDEAEDTAIIDVINQAPVISIPAFTNPVEDHAFSLNIGSDEEALGLLTGSDLVTYRLLVDVDNSGTYLDFNTTNFADGKLNGSEGGQITFDPETGVLNWTTTNADVRTAAYLFQVEATDEHTDANPNFDAKSSTRNFTLTVTNDPTSIGEDDGTGTIIALQDVTLTEDGGSFLIKDAYARDEQSETDKTSLPDGWWSDSYYRLSVTHDGVTTDLVPLDPDDPLASPNPDTSVGTVWWKFQPNQSYVDGSDTILGGGYIWINKDTGAIRWGGATDPNTGGPNNRDVGTYTLTVTHYDGRGDQQTDDFIMTVANDPADLTVPVSKVFYEDPVVGTDPTGYYIIGDTEIESKDEDYGLTYELLINGHSLTDFIATDGKIRPNGDFGGEVIFNQYTGQIEWYTTNADVTRGKNGEDLGLSPYTLTLIATEYSGGPVVPSGTIALDVYNRDPVVTVPQTSFTINEDSKDFQNGSNLYDPINVSSNDEQVESTDLVRMVPEDAYYQLIITTPDAVEHVIVPDPDTMTAPEHGQNWWTFQANTGGGVIHFNKDTGEIFWRDPNDPTADRPNDMDVGVYTFKVVHHDGFRGSDDQSMIVTVENTKPVVTVPAFIDPQEDHSFSLDIGSDDEALGTLTNTDRVRYTLYVDLYNTGNFVEFSSNFSDGKLNGNEGGVIYFAPVTGKLDWEPTNADVRTSGYAFRVTATDRHIGPPDQSLASDPVQFTLTVTNDPTDITAKDVDGNLIPLNGVVNVQEDRSNTSIADLESRDQQSETDKTANPPAGWWKDSYYQLWVTHDSITTLLVPLDPDPSVTFYEFQPNAGYVDPVDGHVVHGGAWIRVDKDTGEIWFYDKDTGLGPDNRDVGDYLFTARHWDGQGTFADTAFSIRVDNEQPSLTVPDTTGSNPPWVFYEDPVLTGATPDPADYYIIPDGAITSNDEDYGLEYELYINGTLWTGLYADSSGNIRPNGPEGGVLTFDQYTGEIRWETRNADVTNESNGDDLDTPLAPYMFTIWADDNNGSRVRADFDVEVWNRFPDISSVPPDPWNIIEDPVTPHTWNIGSNDEESQSTDLSIFRNTYYELYVNGLSGFIGGTQNPAGYAPNLASGGNAIFFDVDSGQISWDPNNADFGHYTFAVIHYDGHGGFDSEQFDVNVQNAQPVWDNFPSDQTFGTGHEFREDAYSDAPADTVRYIIDDAAIQASDEGLGLTYSLYIDGTLWTDLYTDSSGNIRPNGTEGGVLTFGTLTGRVQWDTTNLDVTVDQDGGQFRAPYEIKVVADDNTSSGNRSIENSFNLDVLNDPTTISVNLPGGGSTVTIQEDSHFTLSDADVNAKDEPYGPDFYSLDVRRLIPGLAPADPSQPSFADVGDYNTTALLGNGHSIIFDPVTGAIDWETANQDVGVYEFTVTHHDGHKSDVPTTFTVNVDNTPPEFTTPAPEGEVVRATLWFTYDPTTTEEGQHDWRGDDTVTYSLVQAPPGMVIDPNTGFVQWRTDPAFAGDVTITIMVADGNGGFDIQSFTIVVDVSASDLPFEARLNQQLDVPRFTNAYQQNLGVFDTGHTYQKSPEMILGEEILLPMPTGKAIEDILKAGDEGLDAMLKALENRDLRQPVLDYHGSIPPVTSLYDYAPEVFKGKRLHYGAEEVALWERVEGLNQPGQDFWGSMAPQTPLEGYGAAVEAGKRLNFGYLPIQEATSLRLEDLQAADLLGL